MRLTTLVGALLALATTLGLTTTAEAFCGFYVSGADASLYANATMVVMMRDGNKTVLSMQNNYQGPPEDFAMVVPVPVVLSEETVKTLPRAVFDRVDSLAAPRLVEYWETDPCYVQPQREYMMRAGGAMPPMAAMADAEGGDLGVTIEAQFSVAEYDIVILSAQDSGGLDTWLRRENYNIPDGAEPVLRPYVQQGTKFFVAKVDAERVTFEEGRAVLSPLRFHYDAPEFSLPVRLGLLNSAGQQDLLVHILARGQRYEVANYENAIIPTNLIVQEATRWSFGEFYDLLFRRTVAHNPRSVVTEYSWDASSCDPCPVPALTQEEVTTLGADVVGQPSGFVLTRLHYRYGPDGLGEDLVFRAAPPIVGGRGTPNQQGQLTEERAQPGPINNFQGRYAMLHKWEGAIECENPVRGRWGGPPGQPMPVWGAPNPMLRGEGAGEAANTPAPPADLPPVTAIGLLVTQDVPEIGVVAGQAEAAHPNDPGPAGGTGGGGGEGTGGGAADTPPAASSEGGCASCTVSRGESGLAALLGLGLIALVIGVRRRRR